MYLLHLYIYLAGVLASLVGFATMNRALGQGRSTRNVLIASAVWPFAWTILLALVLDLRSRFRKGAA